jgi:hypothetical protein
MAAVVAPGWRQGSLARLNQSPSEGGWFTTELGAGVEGRRQLRAITHKASRQKAACRDHKHLKVQSETAKPVPRFEDDTEDTLRQPCSCLKKPAQGVNPRSIVPPGSIAAF